MKKIRTPIVTAIVLTMVALPVGLTILGSSQSHAASLLGSVTTPVNNVLGGLQDTLMPVTTPLQNTTTTKTVPSTPAATSATTTSPDTTDGSSDTATASTPDATNASTSITETAATTQTPAVNTTDLLSNQGIYGVTAVHYGTSQISEQRASNLYQLAAATAFAAAALYGVSFIPNMRRHQRKSTIALQTRTTH